MILQVFYNQNDSMITGLDLITHEGPIPSSPKQDLTQTVCSILQVQHSTNEKQRLSEVHEHCYESEQMLNAQPPSVYLLKN